VTTQKRHAGIGAGTTSHSQVLPHAALSQECAIALPRSRGMSLLLPSPTYAATTATALAFAPALTIGDVETIGHSLEDVPQLDAKAGKDRDKHDRDAGCDDPVFDRSDAAFRPCKTVQYLAKQSTPPSIAPDRLYARDRQGVYRAYGLLSTDIGNLEHVVL